MTIAFAAPFSFLRLTRDRIARKVLCTMSAGLRKPANVPVGGTYAVQIVPILSDNFSYILTDNSTRSAIAVDPAEPGPVLSAIESAGLTLSGVLTTHHHWDHSGGNEEIRSQYPELPIFALSSDARRIPACSVLIDDGETAALPGMPLSVRAMHTPCHTTGHVCYLVEVPNGSKVLFTGDTLFVGGCGKFFEGGGAQMERSLNKTLAALDDDTLVFCGHEYTLSNLKFARSIEPGNKSLNDKIEWVKDRLAVGEPTVPTTIGDEKSYNPFMRTSIPNVAAQVDCNVDDTNAVMAALRRAKDNFRSR